jgi:lambda family phage portal protein
MASIESVIGWLSPSWALERQRKRALAAAFKGYYEGAKYRRSNDGWITPSTSANSEVASGLVMLRDRARDLVRNNPYASRIVDVWLMHLIGDGITHVAETGDEALNKLLQERWMQWADSGECDADGQLDYYGQQQLAARTMVESGECLIRMRTRRMSDGLAVPLQMQVLEPDFLDHTKNEQLNNGGVILMGVQFSPLGRREGYWLWRNHPGENLFAWQRASYFVPAEQIIHLYRKTRPGQVRGVTWLHAAIAKLRDLDDYHEALLLKAKIEACLTVIISGSDKNLTVGKAERIENQNVETLSPGSVIRTMADEDVHVVNPSNGGSHEAYTRQFEQNIAVASGITYDQLTGDLRGANFASLRAGKIEFRRDLSQRQWQLMVPMMCEPVWRAFCDMGAAAGYWREGPHGVKCIPPRNEPINPKTDSDAELADLEAGLESWSTTVSKRGYDPMQLAERIKSDDEMLRGKGLERIIPSTAKASPPTDAGV